MRFLVTAGNTREKIDDVRDWGNIFTGNTGLAIARALAALGDVDLLTSNTAHLAALQAEQSASFAIRAHKFSTHAQLKALLAERVPAGAYNAIFMTAAVSDYQPQRVFSVIQRRTDHRSGQEQWIVKDVQAGKVKSTHEMIAVLGVPTEKLIDLFRTQWRYSGLLFKFKLEVAISKEALLEVARSSRIASKADYLIANTLDMVDGPSPGAYLVGEQLEEWVSRLELPARLAELVKQRLLL